MSELNHPLKFAFLPNALHACLVIAKEKGPTQILDPGPKDSSVFYLQTSQSLEDSPEWVLVGETAIFLRTRSVQRRPGEAETLWHQARQTD